MRFRVHGIFWVYWKAFVCTWKWNPTLLQEEEEEEEREVMVRLECVLKMNNMCLRFNEMNLVFKFKKSK